MFNQEKRGVLVRVEQPKPDPAQEEVSAKNRLGLLWAKLVFYDRVVRDWETKSPRGRLYIKLLNVVFIGFPLVLTIAVFAQPFIEQQQDVDQMKALLFKQQQEIEQLKNGK